MWLLPVQYVLVSDRRIPTTGTYEMELGKHQFLAAVAFDTNRVEMTKFTGREPSLLQKVSLFSPKFLIRC